MLLCDDRCVFVVLFVVFSFVLCRIVSSAFLLNAGLLCLFAVLACCMCCRGMCVVFFYMFRVLCVLLCVLFLCVIYVLVLFHVCCSFLLSVVLVCLCVVVVVCFMFN